MGANLSFNSITVGDEIGPIAIPITLQRLVMEAGANRDFSLIHHDREVAQATGASDAYMNTFFIAGMFERLLREWMGSKGHLNKMQNLRMSAFNCVGETVSFKGVVDKVDQQSKRVVVSLGAETGSGVTVTATATVTLP